MIMEMELNKNLERYFKRAGADVINTDGVLFYGWRIAKNQYYLKDWRDNLFLVTKTPGKRYLVEIAENTVFNYKTVVCYQDNKIAKIILCEDKQEARAVKNYAELPFCEYSKIEILDYISFKEGTPVIFYKTALEYIKERLPL